MTWYTVQAANAGYFANTVTVEADTLEEALQRAIEKANDNPGWKSVDHCGATFVDACCIGRDEDPWDDDKSLPVPARFTEKGGPPVVTLTGPPAARRRGSERRHRPHPFRRSRRHRDHGSLRSAAAARQQARGHGAAPPRWGA